MKRYFLCIFVIDKNKLCKLMLCNFTKKTIVQSAQKTGKKKHFCANCTINFSSNCTIAFCTKLMLSIVKVTKFWDLTLCILPIDFTPKKWYNKEGS
jgi:hypothetical protein